MTSALMKTTKYKSTARGAFIGSFLFTVYCVIRAHSEDNLLAFLMGLVFSIPFALLIGKITVNFIRKRILDNEISFRRQETLKYLLYSMIAGSFIFIVVFVISILTFVGGSDAFLDKVFHRIYDGITMILGFLMGILLIATLTQYTWVCSWERKNKTVLIEKKEK